MVANVPAKIKTAKRSRRKPRSPFIIEAEEMKRTLTKNDISVQHFFKETRMQTSMIRPLEITI